MKNIVKILTTFLAGLLLTISAIALAQDDAPAQTLITNVNVFDGHAEELARGMNVLVEGNLIKQISAEPINAAGATAVDAH